MTKEIIAKEGFGGLYRGLSAGLLRQATYTTARLGIFNNLSIYLKKANDGKARTLFHPSVCVPHTLPTPLWQWLLWLPRLLQAQRIKVSGLA